MEFLAKGKRGEVYVATYQGKKVVVKQERKGIKAINRLENEAHWLEKLNKQGIGPKFINFNEGKLMMAFVQGEPIGEYLKRNPLSKPLVKEIMEQCRALDKLQVNKLEMHHPFKHILIKQGKVDRSKVVMIDFERCKQTEKPKNVTQFCQYVLKHRNGKTKGVKEALQQYKETYSQKDFLYLLATVLSP